MENLLLFYSCGDDHEWSPEHSSPKRRRKQWLGSAAHALHRQEAAFHQTRPDRSRLWSFPYPFEQKLRQNSNPT